VTDRAILRFRFLRRASIRHCDLSELTYEDRIDLPVEAYSESDLSEKTNQLFEFFLRSRMKAFDQIFGSGPSVR
jgi:hypothetical protein